MKNLWLITKEDFLNLITNPMWVFYATAFPVLLVLILGYLTGDSYGGMISSYDYYGVTLIIYAIFNSGMTSANAFMEEKIRKPNMRMIYAPGSIGNLYLSKIIASFLFSFLFHMLDLLLFYLLFHIQLENAGHLLILLGMAELFSVTLGIMICCLVKSESMTNQIQSIVVNILALLGGVLFSMDGYGELVRKISMLSPVKWIVKASFEMIYDYNLHLFLPVTGFLAAGIAVMLLICRISFRKEDCIC